ncbi:MAG: NUDIX domain-containing protein [Oscillospiraceae bacterium]|nr:NUDIX domain-containing protein [Oscillospiraceae bacterium]
MEYLDLCDENGLPTGEVINRSRAHREGLRHRTAHVWIVRRCGNGYRILLQKRSAGKDSFPGLYDTSSAGHIPAGAEPLPSALRELSEELGIAARPEDLHFAGIFRNRYEAEFRGEIFRDNEVTWVYVFFRPVDSDSLKLQEEEVEAVDWFDLQEVREEITRSCARFCVAAVGLDVLIDYLKRNPFLLPDQTDKAP